MKFLFLLPLTLVILSCFGTKENKNDLTNDSTKVTEDKIYIEKFDSLAGSELEKLLTIEIKHKFKEKYSGQYSYKLKKSGDKMLHGNFFLFFADSSKMDDMVSLSKTKYSGQFNEGKKVGQFTEQLLFDDGVDLYSKWTIKIDFDNDQCKTGTFFGVIGTAMPETTYRFENLMTCSFDNVTTLAQQEWSKEFEKRKNSR